MITSTETGGGRGTREGSEAPGGGARGGKSASRGQSASGGKIGMWVFLASDVMGFGGLLLAYAVLRVRSAAWPDPSARFDRPLAGALTFVLLFSGATMTAAVAAAREGRRRAARFLLACTALAGLVFVGGQALEFHDLATTRRVGLTADHAAALFYVITGYHGLHVLVGVAVLCVMAAKFLGSTAALSGSAQGQSVDDDAVAPGAVAAVEVTSLYWQFVDVVWIVIFTVFYLLPTARG